MPLLKLNRANQQSGHVLTLGFITDTHLCSKFQRLDVLDYAYDIFEERGIKTVLHAGNIVDGESKVNTHDLLVHGIAEQAHYVIEHYPAKKGITTYYIDGDDHEGWWFQREGIEFGRYLMFEALAAGRDDLKYMGYMENDVEMVPGNKKTVIRIVHPGGGSSYAHSYTAQKIVESYTPGEKPSILLIGHYHKANFGVIRGVHCIQGGCTQDQSTFMRKKRLEAHVGFWILTVELDSNGAVSRFLPEFFNFFDKGYVIKRDGIVL
jgi:predicted phosphodiesterase